MCNNVDPNLRLNSMKKTLVVALAIGAAALLGGCSDAPRPQSRPTPADDPSPRGEILVRYHVSGGLIGINSHLVVYESGRAEVTGPTTEPRTIELNEQQMQQIRSALENGQWDDRIRPSGDPAADGFSYTVLYDGHRISAADPNVPGWLAEITHVLNTVALDTE
jgi:hypothetical protein